MNLTLGLLGVILFSSFTVSRADDTAAYLSRFKETEQIIKAPSNFVFPLDGRPWLIVIFKSCCAPNTMAVKWSASLEKRWGESLGILGIVIDSPRSISKVIPWMKGHSTSYPVIWDANNELTRLIGVRSTPMVILLNRGGSEAFRSSWFNWSDAKKIEALLEIEIK